MVGQSNSGGSLITFKDFVCGTFAGWLQVIVGQPFDIIKVRIQAQSPINPKYKGTIDCARQIYVNEGLLSFYKGTVSPLVGVGACVSIQFGVNEACKRILKKLTNKTNLSLFQLSSCGGIAGLANSIVSIPVEHVRIKLQTQGTRLIKKYTGSFDCLKKLYAEGGLKAIYHGGMSTLPRELIAYFFYFGTYEGLMQFTSEKYYKNDRSLITTYHILLFGALSGFGEWLPGYPFDVIKSKYQADDVKNPKYTSVLNCAKSIYRSSGVRGFYSGIVPCLLRAPPANAATFLGFEWSLKLWDSYKIPVIDNSQASSTVQTGKSTTDNSKKI
jgi:solute carrier family 25 (mitochondrial carnitine/acylcarnitine transporter), member 20/29